VARSDYQTQSATTYTLDHVLLECDAAGKDSAHPRAGNAVRPAGQSCRLCPVRRKGRKLGTSLSKMGLPATAREDWRRGSESNRRIKVLQTSPLPLGYRAPAHHVSVPCGKCPSAGNDRVWSENWSGRRDLNPRLRPWQGRTLPLSYSRSLPHSKSLPTTTSNHCTRQVLSSGVNLSRTSRKGAFEV
jgi:hypothetical protein